MMRVELIQGSGNATELIADIASICYGHKRARKSGVLVRNLDILGHHSVFEHAFYTFYIEGITRACLGQLTRHRHASFTVRSQRYCDESDMRMVIPEKIAISSYAKEFDKIALANKALYEEMIEDGINREDARAILPQASTTDLYITLNLRELIHIYNLRTSEGAQQEINHLLHYMIDELLDLEPELKFLFKEDGQCQKTK